MLELMELLTRLWYGPKFVGGLFRDKYMSDMEADDRLEMTHLPWGQLHVRFKCVETKYYLYVRAGTTYEYGGEAYLYSENLLFDKVIL